MSTNENTWSAVQETWYFVMFPTIDSTPKRLIILKSVCNYVNIWTIIVYVSPRHVIAYHSTYIDYIGLGLLDKW